MSETLVNINPSYALLVGTIGVIMLFGATKAVKTWMPRTTLFVMSMMMFVVGPASIGTAAATQAGGIEPWAGGLIGGGAGAIAVAIACVILSCNYDEWNG